MKFEFQFGKVTYKPGAPKNLPRWVCCACGNISGSFKRRRWQKRMRRLSRWPSLRVPTACSTNYEVHPPSDGAAQSIRAKRLASAVGRRP
jgi:hypothetical protein